MRRIASALIAATAVTLLATSAIADHAADLATARKQYEAQDYDKAIRLLRPVARDTQATRSQRIDAYELLGLSHLILGATEAARAAFTALLDLDPRHELRDPSGSPKLHAFYASVRESHRGPQIAALAHTTPSRAIAGLRARFHVEYAPGARRAQLKWRRTARSAFHVVELATDKDGFSAAFLLPNATASYALAYYVEAHDEQGRVVGRAGSASSPLRLLVDARRSATTQTPLYKRWWFWTAIGAAVVAATVTGIAVGAGDTPEGNLPPGIFKLP